MHSLCVSLYGYFYSHKHTNKAHAVTLMIDQNPLLFKMCNQYNSDLQISLWVSRVVVTALIYTRNNQNINIVSGD